MPVAAQWVGSPNVTPGRRGYRPLAIVIHIMQGTLSGTDSWFAAPQSQVSAHYGIGKNGVIHQYVKEGDTAWHAGRVSGCSWALLQDGVNPNFYTIGIEHEGDDATSWTPAMYEASSSLVADLANRWSIPLDRRHVIGHREIYALKPFCPGSGVDLDRLIALARKKVASPDQYNAVADAGTAKATAAINIRRGAPTTLAPVARVAPPDTDLPYVAWVSNGQSVHGNAHWYQTADGDFFWAGATDAPVPRGNGA